MSKCGDKIYTIAPSLRPNNISIAFDVLLSTFFFTVFQVGAQKLFEQFLFPDLGGKGDKSRPSPQNLKRRNVSYDAFENYIALFLPRSLHGSIFSVTFALSWMSMHCLWCEIVGWLHPWSRELVWQTSLHLLVGMLLFVVPWFCFYSVLQESLPQPPIRRVGILKSSKSDMNLSLDVRSNKTGQLRASPKYSSRAKNLASLNEAKPVFFFEPFSFFPASPSDIFSSSRSNFLATCMLLPYWLALLKLKQLPLDFHHKQVNANAMSFVVIVWPLRSLWCTSAMRVAVCRLGVIGSALAAVLSGLGAANMPFDLLHSAHRSKKINVDVVASRAQSLEQQVHKTLERLSAKKRQHFEERSRRQSITGHRDVSLLGSIFRTASDGELKLSMLKDEIDSLENLSQDLFIELVSTQQARNTADSQQSRASSLIRVILAAILSVACIVRVSLAFLNVVTRRDQMAVRGDGEDVATTTVRLLQHWGFRFQSSLWARCISLAFVGFLMISSAQGFILTVSRGRSAALTAGGLPLFRLSAEVLAPLTTQLMGTFLLSSLLLIRINVPCEYRYGAMATVLGDVEFGFYHQWFDTIFVISTVCAVAVRFFQSGGAVPLDLR